MELTSPVFPPNQPIPAKHTNKGAGISPPLLIQNVPAGTQSLALIVHDPDAPKGDFVHWLVWNLSATASMMPEGRTPAAAVEGTNDFGNAGYAAPAPPSGTHHYVFDLYALNTMLSLPAGATRSQLLAAMDGHIVATSQLIGTASA
jgi:Raf kinase inhibitor-like YbhB/YbcL family protein